MLVAIVITPGRPGLGDDLGLARVLLGVEHGVRQLGLVEQAGDSSEFSIEVVPTSTGWPRLWQSRMSSITAVELLAAGLVDEVELVLADGRQVRRDHHRLEAVDLLELVGLGVGRAGHAGELAVHAEVVLEGDRGERLVLALDRHAFLGLDRLVQAVAPAPAGHEAAGELVDDHHLGRAVLALSAPRSAGRGGRGASRAAPA
jgi:hypothetical protein